MLSMNRCADGLIQNPKSGPIICVIHETKSVYSIFINQFLVNQCAVPEDENQINCDGALRAG